MRAGAQHARGCEKSSSQVLRADRLDLGQRVDERDAHGPGQGPHQDGAPVDDHPCHEDDATRA